MLNSAVVNAWLWTHIGILLIVVAYATCGSALLPTAAERGRERLAHRPIRTLAVGIGISVPWMLIAILMMAGGQGSIIGLLGVVMTIAWMLTALLGLASVASHVGARGESGPLRWTTTARGAALLALTWMLPIVGWFVALPLSLACGLGCLVGRRPVQS